MGRQQLNINLPDDVAAYLDSVPNKTDTVVRAIRQVMNAERSNEMERRVRRIEDTLVVHGIELVPENRIVYVSRDGLEKPLIVNEGEVIIPKPRGPIPTSNKKARDKARGKRID